MPVRSPIRLRRWGFLLAALLALAPAAVSTASLAVAADKPCVTTTGLPVNRFSAAPDKTTDTVGKPHTVTATVVVDSIDASGVCVRFTKNSGPSKNSDWPRYKVANSSGEAAITWTSTATGTDSILAVALDNQGNPVARVIVTHAWTATPKPKPSPTRTTAPTRKPTVSPTPAPPPRRTTSPTHSPTASATPTPTPSTTVSSSPSPTTSPTPVPLASGFDDGSIQLDRPSALPGGSVTLNGRNCPSGATVTYAVEGASAGFITAEPDGTFSGEVQLPDASIGEHLIEVTCGGRTATVPIDLVVSSSTSTPASGATAGAVLVFFVLIGSVLFSRTSPSPRTIPPPEPDSTP